MTNGVDVTTEVASVMWILQEYCDRGTLIDAGVSCLPNFGTLIWHLNTDVGRICGRTWEGIPLLNADIDACICSSAWMAVMPS